LPYARRLLNLSDTASSLVSGEGNRPALRLGITTEQADQFLPEILRRFTALHPQVGVQIDCSVSSVLARKLADGLLDVALTIRHADTPAGETIDIEDLVWIAHPDMQWDRDSALPIAANPEGCIHRAHAIDALARAGLDWTVRYVSDSAAAVNATVAAGLAVAVKSRRSIPPGMVEIDEVFDLPALAPVTVDLHRAPTAVTQADDDLVAVVREVCGRRSALSAT
jgi:Transcriptional regulator